MSVKNFPRGVEYMISLATSVLRRNLAEGSRDPMVDVKVRLPKATPTATLTSTMSACSTASRSSAPSTRTP